MLALPKTALFCSARCPGDAILAAYDQAARWRETARCIISGFHSPVEKECLRILLRGSQPVIICPARSLEKMRLPVRLEKTVGRRTALDSFLLQPQLSAASPPTRRPAKRICRRVLADEVWFAHITPGGEMQRLAHKIAARD